jgi:hypothetical protein
MQNLLRNIVSFVAEHGYITYCWLEVARDMNWRFLAIQWRIGSGLCRPVQSLAITNCDSIGFIYTI